MKLESLRLRGKNDPGVLKANGLQDALRDAILGRDITIFDEWGNVLEVRSFAIDETSQDMDYTGQKEELQVTVITRPKVAPWPPVGIESPGDRRARLLKEVEAVGESKVEWLDDGCSKCRASNER